MRTILLISLSFIGNLAYGINADELAVWQAAFPSVTEWRAYEVGRDGDRVVHEIHWGVLDNSQTDSNGAEIWRISVRRNQILTISEGDQVVAAQLSFPGQARYSFKYQQGVLVPYRFLDGDPFSYDFQVSYSKEPADIHVPVPELDGYLNLHRHFFGSPVRTMPLPVPTSPVLRAHLRRLLHGWINTFLDSKAMQAVEKDQFSVPVVDLRSLTEALERYEKTRFKFAVEMFGPRAVRRDTDCVRLLSP